MTLCHRPPRMLGANLGPRPERWPAGSLAKCPGGTVAGVRRRKLLIDKMLAAVTGLGRLPIAASIWVVDAI